MKSLFTFVILFALFALRSQSICPSAEIKDSLNKNSALISCDYPFNAEGCIELHANFTDIKYSSEYLVESIDYSPAIAYDTGTLVNIASDDTFSQVIDLPFSFCFFGENYEQIVIADNGLVSFDTSLALGDSPYYSSDLPNPALFNSTIFGLYHDITNDDDVFGCSDDPNTGVNECGEIRYQVVGQAPCRAFVINFNNLNHFNDESSRSRFQIVLYEATSYIEVNIAHKPINNETSMTGQNRKYASIGIQNQNGLVAYTPEGRNNAIFETNNESWRFTPNGESVVSFLWYEGDEVIGAGETLEICHRQPAEIVLEAIYDLCDGNSYTLSDTFMINYADSYPRVTPQTVQLCDIGMDQIEVVNLNDYTSTMVNNNYPISFFTDQNEAENGVNALTQIENVQIHNSEKFFVKLSADENCFEINELNFEIAEKPQADNLHFEICDLNNDNSETIDLTAYTPDISNNNSQLAVTYYSCYENAMNSQNPITELTLNGPGTAYVRMDMGSGCSTVEAMIFLMKPAPEIDDMEVQICDNEGKVNLWEFLDPEIIDTYSDINFYKKEVHAIQQSHRIGNPNHYRLNGIQQLFVRVNLGEGCYDIAAIAIEYFDAVSPDKDIRVQCDSDRNEVEVFDLSLSIPDMLDDVSGLTISYFITQEGALENDEQVKINNYQSYEIPLSSVDVFVRFQTAEGCVSVKPIKLHAVPIPEPVEDMVSICDLHYEEDQTKPAELLDPRTIGDQIFVENSYYWTVNEAENQQNPLSEILLTPEADVQARMAIVFEGEELCHDIYPIHVQMVPPDQDMNVLDVEICDNQNDGFEYIDLSLIPELGENFQNLEEAQYFEENGDRIQNPYYYTINSSRTISVRQSEDLAVECPEGVDMQITFAQAVVAKDILQYFCDEYPFDEETLNLYDIVVTDQPNLSGSEIQFYNTQLGALTRDENDRIENPESFVLNVSVLVMYGVVAGGDLCDSVIQIALKLKHAPHPQTEELLVCDTDNNGNETITLYDYILPLFNTPSYHVAFYATEEDAINEVNALQTADVNGELMLYFVAKNECAITCSIAGEVTFRLMKTPSSSSQDHILCDNNNDDTEFYDLSIHESDLISSYQEFTFSYFYTEADALADTNAISDTTNAVLTTENHQIFVRIENDNHCFDIAVLNFQFAPAPMTQNIEIGSCDDDFNLSETFNLTSYEADIVANPENFDIQFYRSYAAALASDNEELIPNADDYTTFNMMEVLYAKVIDPSTSCYSIAEIYIEIYKLPKLVDTSVQVCDNDFDGDYEIILGSIDNEIIEEVGAYTFEYYETYEDAVAQNNIIDREEVYSVTDLSQGVYVRVTNDKGCSAISYSTFTPGEITPAKLPEGTNIANCDDDYNGIVAFDLTEVRQSLGSGVLEVSYFETIEDAQLNESPIQDPQNYYNLTPKQTLFVRITEGEKCSNIEHFDIKVNRLPKNPFPEKFEKCPSETLVIDAGEAESYLWNTGDTSRFLEVINNGNYEVSLTNEFGCEATFNVPVSNYATHSVNYVFTDKNTVVFDVIGQSIYEFSLDGKNWQSSNVFFGLTQGVYNIYVRDIKTECVISAPFLVFDWVNIITPNGDGINDSWTECGLEVFGKEKSKLTIFDRYGKTVHSEMSNDCFEWNGKYTGRALPSDTYWFTVELPDGRKFNGFIAIKNYDNGTTIRY